MSGVVNTLEPAGADVEYGKRIKKNIREYESFALRNGSLSIRNAFSLAATNFQLQDSALYQFLEARRPEVYSGAEKRACKEWNDQAFLALARILANQRVEEDDLDRSARMFQFAIDIFGAETLKSSDRLIFLEVLGELGRYEELKALAERFNVAAESPVHLSLLLQNEVHAEAAFPTQKWLDKLNALYQTHGVSTIELETSATSAPLDCINTCLQKYYDGPLVSVIVPSYRGGETLLTAIESLLNQSWKNLEIIVVDDGSGPEFESYLERAESLSLKVRVKRQAQNLGAYSARNLGLSEAKGEFVTVHDDDDWSHGDKIATQVRYLLRHPHVAANMTSHTRVTENLRFVRINNNPFLLQPNYSSLMMRRTHLLEMGGWDPTNRGADSELRQRVQLRFGKDVKVLGTVPLSFTRTWDGSLTSGEIQRGFIDPARTLYQSSYKHWHRKAKGNSDLLKPSSPRNYAIPTNLQAGKRHEDLGHFDVVFMTDFRFPGGTTSLTLAEIRASSLEGYRVGFIHAESPLNSTRDPVSYELFEMQRKGVVTQISLQDSADIRLLLVRHPSVVTYLDSSSANLRVQKSFLIVNNPPVLRGGTGMVFDLPQAIENMDRIFGCKTAVVAESGVIRRLCEAFVPPERLTNTTWPGMVKERPFSPPNFEGVPEVGRHSRDHALKWPSSRAIFDKVYSSEEFQTVFLGGAEALLNKYGSGVLRDKTVYQFNEISVDDFLNKVDFWVYFHDSQLTESFGMAIAEAMAAGKVVVLPEYLEQTFGEGAVYTEPEYVEGTVLYYWRNPSLYFEQSNNARRYVLENFSVKSFLNRVENSLKY